MNNQAHLHSWKRNRAIVECSVKEHDIVVNVNNLLIPFSPTQPQEHYDLYRAEAEFPGLVAQYANILVAGLLRKPPQCSLEGVDIGLVSEAIVEELTTGRGLLWVDSIGGIRVLKAEELVEWSTGFAKVSVVGEAAIQSNYEYRIVDGKVHCKRWDNGEVKFDDFLLVKGVALSEIPIFPLNGSINVTKSILQPLIEREISLYNKLSRRNHLLYGAATYTPVISSDISDQQFKEIVDRGIGSWIRLNKGESAAILAAPTEALDRMEKAIASSIEDMARMGIRILSPEGGNSSGVALEIRNSAQTAQLGLLNVRASAAFSKALSLYNKWTLGAEDDVEFSLSADFNPVPLGSDWMRLVTDWYQGGLIPRALWLEIAKANDVVPSDYDDDAGRKSIEADPLVPGRTRINID